MITAAVLRTNGTYSLFKYDPRDASALKALQEKVGGFIEAAPIFDRSLTMYCNEEGKLQDLPVNRYATLLLAPDANDVIAGDVVLVGGADEEGYDTTLPPMILLALKEGGGDDEQGEVSTERS